MAAFNGHGAEPLLSLVICTLDEADCIGGVLKETGEALAGVSYEIVVVDDSDDMATADVVLAYARKDARIRLIRRSGSRGLASAAIAGWEVARGDVLAIMDGDGQHDPRLVREMLVRLIAGKRDLVVASRFTEDGPSGMVGWRYLISRAGIAFTDLMLGVHSTDPLSGLFVMRRDWFEAARPRLSGVGFKILIDVMASGPRRPKITEVGTSLRTRLGGESKLDMRVILDLAALLLDKRTRGLIPARFSLFAAVGSTGVAVHLAALTLAMESMALPFWIAQALAIFVAMNSNFFLNNVLTFRDKRLRGLALWSGLIAFDLSCAGGALLGEAVGSLAKMTGLHWVVAGVGGAFAAALWNYVAASGAVWREGGVLRHETERLEELSAQPQPAGSAAGSPR